MIFFALPQGYVFSVQYSVFSVQVAVVTQSQFSVAVEFNPNTDSEIAGFFLSHNNSATL
jgi:hypothetical protein